MKYDPNAVEVKIGGRTVSGFSSLSPNVRANPVRKWRVERTLYKDGSINFVRIICEQDYYLLSITVVREELEYYGYSAAHLWQAVARMSCRMDDAISGRT